MGLLYSQRNIRSMVLVREDDDFCQIYKLCKASKGRGVITLFRQELWSVLMLLTSRSRLKYLSYRLEFDLL